jgi:cytochrome c oxidase subunit 2
MPRWIPLMPEAASTVAADVDRFYFFLVGLSLFFALLIAGLEIYFAIRYRRRSPHEVPRPVRPYTRLEVLWIVVPFLLSMVIFGWGAILYHRLYSVPEDAMEIYVTGKQWMWRAQHMNGVREINELHVPLGRPIELVLASEDVIHDFSVPAFRTKVDVIPGRFTHLWFEATRAGRYRLYCAEYCGTNHSRMGGFVYAMEPADFARWLEGGEREAAPAATGAQLFTRLFCDTCHRPGSGRGPELAGLYGTEVTFSDGRTAIADEGYLREAILDPQARLVAGHTGPVVMPAYRGQLAEEQILQLIAYIKSIPGGRAEARIR